MFIDGEWVEHKGEVFRSLDPYTGEEWAELPQADAMDVDRAVCAARRAFDEGPWPRLSGAERARLMRRLASLIEDSADELALLEVRDNGKLLREMAAQVRSLPDWYYF